MEVINEVFRVYKVGFVIICNRVEDVVVILWYKFIEIFCFKMF